MREFMTRLNDWLDGVFPHVEDEAGSRRQRFIVLIAMGVLPLCLVGVVHEAIVRNGIGVAINAFTLLLNATALVGIRKGYGEQVALPMVFITLFTSNLAAAAVGGAGGSGFAGNFVILVFAAIILPRWAVVVVVLTQTFMAWAMFAFPMEHAVVEFSEDMHVWTWFVCLALTGGMVAALVTVTEGLLDRANEKSNALETTLQELRETSVSRDFVQGVLSAMPDFVVVADAEYGIVMVNGAFERVAHWQQADLIGRPLTKVLVWPAGTPRVGEARLRHQDGQSVPVSVSRGELPNPNDEKPLFVWSATDIRDQHATADALRQAHQRAEAASVAKSSFLANMSHELRTPLNAIIGYGELLSDELEEPSHLADLSRVGAAARTLLELINGVLDLSRVESGKVELEFDVLPLHDVVDPVVNLVEPLAVARGLELRINDLDRNGESIYTDGSKLRQVLTNLMTNAIKFTSDGHIELKATRWERSGLGWLRFEVIDTGIGMEDADLERVFEPFAQVNDSKVTEFGGTGLGLSISRAFIEMMGGQIYAESTVGVGSRFVIEVPAAQHARRVSTPSRSAKLPAPGTCQTSILVVDDDESFLELVHRVLGSEERQVVCTTDPLQGLDWADRHTADLILADVEMPGVTGWGFLVRLQATRSADAPVVVISGEGDPEVAHALGANRFMHKPVRNQELRDAVDEILLSRELARKAARDQDTTAP